MPAGTAANPPVQKQVGAASMPHGRPPQPHPRSMTIGCRDLQTGITTAHAGGDKRNSLQNQADQHVVKFLAGAGAFAFQSLGFGGRLFGFNLQVLDVMLPRRWIDGNPQ